MVAPRAGDVHPRSTTSPGGEMAVCVMASPFCQLRTIPLCEQAYDEREREREGVELRYGSWWHPEARPVSRNIQRRALARPLNESSRVRE